MPDKAGNTTARERLGLDATDVIRDGVRESTIHQRLAFGGDVPAEEELVAPADVVDGSEQTVGRNAGTGPEQAKAAPRKAARKRQAKKVDD